MCGRCITLTYDEVLGVIREIETSTPFNISPDWPARPTSVYPGRTAPLITPGVDTAMAHSMSELHLSAEELTWGFEASWKRGLLFNTRIDSAGKPTWRESFEHRRCLLPCRAFYETSDTEKGISERTGKEIKRAYEFRMADSPVTLLGAIRQDGRYSLVTTEPNQDMAPIHHRMPLVVRPDEVGIWLGPDYARLADRAGIRLDVKPA